MVVAIIPGRDWDRQMRRYARVGCTSSHCSIMDCKPPMGCRNEDRHIVDRNAWDQRRVVRKDLVKSLDLKMTKMIMQTPLGWNPTCLA